MPLQAEGPPDQGHPRPAVPSARRTVSIIVVGEWNTSSG